MKRPLSKVLNAILTSKVIRRLKALLAENPSQTPNEQDLWLYDLITHPQGCYKWHCFCQSQDFIKSVHVKILDRLSIQPARADEIDALTYYRRDDFDPCHIVPQDARQAVFEELVSGINELEPLLEHHQLDEQTFAAFRRLIRLTIDGGDFAGLSETDRFQKLRGLFGDGSIASYLEEMHRHYNEGLRRRERHILEEEAARAARVERIEKQAPIKRLRARERAERKRIRDPFY